MYVSPLSSVPVMMLNGGEDSRLPLVPTTIPHGPRQSTAMFSVWRMSFELGP
jgi:hypothetical protein